MLARKHDVLAIRSTDRFDRTIPDVGRLTLRDAETGEVVEIDTTVATRRGQLESAARAVESQIRTLVRGSRVDLLELDTLRPYVGPLIGFFRARGGRA